MLNCIIIQGRLKDDVELRYTQSNTAVCSAVLAVQRSRKTPNGEYPVDWIDVVFWGKTAEHVHQWFHKGDMAVVRGRLESRDWEDRNGNRRRSWEVQAESIDFAGGTEMEFNMHTAVTQDIQTEVSDLFKDATGVDASSVTSSGDDNEDVLIRSTSIDSEQRAAVIDKMLEKYSLADTDILNNNDVSASVGSDLQRSAFLCSILAILLMLVYITFRFELTSGLAAICCLVHDLLVMLSVYVLLQIPLDSNFIAAALTILGYSINASIIVFDRVRENLRTARKEPFEVIGEKSIWQTMGRTINTTLTTLFTIGMVYILGVPSLKQFTLPLIVGILAGGWSSVMLSTGLWGFFRKKFRRRRKI